MSVSSAVDRPSTATMKSPSLTSTPISVSGERSAGSQFWPFRILDDLEELRRRVALEPRAEQAHRDPRRLRHVAAADVGVAGVQLADQLADDVGQVRTVVDVRRASGAYFAFMAGQSTPCMFGA